MIFSPFFIIICIFIIIVLILILGVDYELKVILREIHVEARISFIFLRFPSRFFLFVVITIDCECLRLILRRDLYLFSSKPKTTKILSSLIYYIYINT